MNKWRRINLLFFLFVVIASTLVLYFLGMDFLLRSGKPWHLQPSVSEDSLSQHYCEQCLFFDKKRMSDQIEGPSKTKVLILVEGWGVPLDDSLLDEDFSLFSDLPCKVGLHRRLLNRTKHAEQVELRNADSAGIFIFGGDSLEYERKEYIPALGYKESIFCQLCSDSTVAIKLDSVLVSRKNQKVAWTTQDSRSGDRKRLHDTLRKIASLAKKHAEVLFIVQGTHRPILGSPEIRRMYKSHWVPVIILNGF